MAKTVGSGRYYVYGLVDPAARRQTKDDLLSIFYVGKGSEDRWQQHELNELRDLRREMNLVTRGSKAERIRQILDRGEKIPAIRLSSGYHGSEDAERAESLAIALINALLKRAGRSPLTNGNLGNYSGFLRLPEHFRFVFAEQLEVPPGGDEPVLLVKGNAEELRAGGHRVLRDGLPAQFGPWTDRIKILGDGDPGEEFPRQGWDPNDPWDDTEARERGRRYWKIGRDTVLDWLQNPAAVPRHLLLAIPAGADTVVRYAWQIDPDGEWEYYLTGTGEFSGWGVPLGKRAHKHPLLGKSLVEERDGKRVQVLQNYAQGWRVLHV